MGSRAAVNRGGALIWKLGEKHGAFSLNSTPPTAKKMSSSAAAATAPGGDHAHGQQKQKWATYLRGEYAPVAVALGLIMLSASFGLYTAKQQLEHAPNVYLSKKKRETVPEVQEPDYAVRKAEDFISKSFFRRMAHAQKPRRDQVVPDPIRGDPLPVSQGRSVESLQSVGVEPATS
ncbi:unnamed protein product [Victoria cruziana]